MRSTLVGEIKTFVLGSIMLEAELEIEEYFVINGPTIIKGYCNS